MKATVAPLGKRILRSDLFQTIAARVLFSYLWLAFRTNRPVAGSQDLAEIAQREGPLIIALWHGQQMLVQFTRPAGEKVAGLVSRSADAEINARVLLLSGNEVVRGSGGRVRAATERKGGVKALIALRNALRRGRHVVMIADISKGAPRQAGEGIVRLAKISGRPIVPLALATSRHHIVEKAWDRMTINLPFGRRCVKIGAPIRVSRDADEAALESARQAVTAGLDQVTKDAYEAVESKG
ncbi:lysophospholipid acyltransferase family protein [Pararhizobium haloflavum]|uniref:lysophospholipid acyltransferase family protein n=1 Tax=Pararhizobium haloflavum TaxID=2037914 RepID=UPI000C180E36|nr:lysophospholipid acyltransferase family protein [Pararhizobium haloflavum]